MAGRHLIRSRRTTLALGVIAFLGGAYLIHDAYEGRDQPAPWWAAPFTFW